MATIIFMAFCFGAMFAPSLMNKQIDDAINEGIVLM